MEISRQFECSGWVLSSQLGDGQSSSLNVVGKVVTKMFQFSVVAGMSSQLVNGLIPGPDNCAVTLTSDVID